MKHTPGPWIAPQDQGNLVVTKEDWDSLYIHKKMQILITPVDTPETAANAQLVAAAPEMLQMLQILVSGITQPFPILLARLQKAEALIERITGAGTAKCVKTKEPKARMDEVPWAGL